VLTQFGKLVRKYRIDRDVKLYELADALGKTSSYISAVENGKKRITNSLVSGVIDYFKLVGDAKSQMEEAASLSRNTYTLDVSN